MKENVAMGAIAAAIAAATMYMRDLIVPICILLIAMVSDYVTGMARAWMTKTLSSRVGIKGIVKKVAYLLAVACGILVDWVIQSSGERLGVNLTGFYFVGLLVTIWLILNECISILENLEGIGTPLPGFLMKLLHRLKNAADSKGDDLTKDEDAEAKSP